MQTADSRVRGGPGILPLQDHRSSRDISLDQRQVILGVRVLDRDGVDGLGRIIEDDDARGDLIGGFFWEKSSREISACSFVFPSQTVGLHETITVASGPRGSNGAIGSPGPKGAPGVDPDGKGGSPGTKFGFIRAAPISQPKDAFNFVGAGGLDPQGGGTIGIFGVFDSRPIFTIHDPDYFNRDPKQGKGSTGSEGASGDEGEQAPDELYPTPRIFPTRGQDWKVDTRFSSILSPSPKGWPSFPSNWHGITVQSTDEDRQIEYFQPTDPRIPLVHIGDPVSAGALVCDIEPKTGRPIEDRHARLHTMLRIVKSPTGSPSLQNCVAWNLTTTGKGDGKGGYVVDLGVSVGKNDRSRGPTTPGSGPNASEASKFRGANGGIVPGSRGINDRFRNPILQGGDSKKLGERFIVGMVSHKDGGPFHVGTDGDPHRKGTDGDGNPINSLHLTTKALFINPDDVGEDGPLNFTDFLPGVDLDYSVAVYLGWNPRIDKFDFNTTAAEEDPPYDPPYETPPVEPPEDPPDPPTPPDSPPVDRPPPLPPVRRRGQVLASTGIPSGMYGTPDGRVQEGASPFLVGRSHTRRWREMQIAAMSFRAQRWGEGLPDLIHSRLNGRRVEGPTVLRIDTFAKQPDGEGGDYDRNREDDEPPYCGGTADGGVWITPPEVSGEDYSEDFAPGERSISSSTFGIGLGVQLAFGLPDLLTGGVRSGVAIKDASGDLSILGFDSDGVGTERARILNTGGFLHEDIATDPTAPATGVIVYAKSGALYGVSNANVPFGIGKKSVADLLTASTTQTQGEGPLTEDFNVVTTCANANDVRTLPAIDVGREVIVENLGAETLQIFPASGASIDGGATDASTTLVSGASVRFIARSATNWRTA